MKLQHVRRKLSAALAVTVIASVAAGCGAADGAADGEEVTTIRYQTSGSLIDLGELAQALGYIDGIKLDRVGEVQGGPASLQALATKQVDIGGAFNGALAKVVSTGVPITGVLAYYGSSEDSVSALLTLKGSDITSAKDLIGKEIAVNTLGANSEAIIDTYLTKEGLSKEEIAKVTLVPLPSLNAEAALREKQVDAAYLGQVAKEIAVSRGGVESLFTDVDLVGPYNGGSLALRDDFIKDNPQTTKKLVAGMAKALEYSQTQPQEKTIGVITKYLKEHNRGEEAAALAHWKGAGVATPGGVIRDQDFDIWLDWLGNEGEVDSGSIKAGDIYTNEFNPYAEEK